MVDGVAATDLMSVMFSDTTAGAAPREWAPAPEPSGIELSRARSPTAPARTGSCETLRRVLGAPLQTLRSLAETARATAAASSSMRPCLRPR